MALKLISLVCIIEIMKSRHIREMRVGQVDVIDLVGGGRIEHYDNFFLLQQPKTTASSW